VHTKIQKIAQIKIKTNIAKRKHMDIQIKKETERYCRLFKAKTSALDKKL